MASMLFRCSVLILEKQDSIIFGTISCIVEIIYSEVAEAEKRSIILGIS